jgi:uncharacterized protein
MRAVADTNVVVSGLLWQGPSRRVLDLARSGRIRLFTTAPLLAELEDVLSRNKLSRRLELASVAPRDLVLGYSALTNVVTPAPIDPVILADPDDDAVLACALAARAELVISGDGHLLDLREFRGIYIVSPSNLLSREDW